MPHRFPAHIRIASIYAFLALMVLLAAPFSTFSQMPVPDEQSFVNCIDCCGGSLTEEAPGTSQPSSDGCCAGESCCSACNAPLGTVVLLPALTTFTGSLAGFEPFLHFPEVYLPIFVPPESLS